MTRKRLKKPESRDMSPEVRAAFDRYKAKPLAPDALDNLRRCFREVERVEDPEQRQVCANAVLEAISAKRDKKSLWSRMDWFVVTAISSVLAISAIGIVTVFLSTNSMRKEAPRQRGVQVTRIDTRKEEPDSLKRITPNDSLVLKAIAKGTREGSLNISQILDVYDFVVSHIEYRNVLHPTIPRWPRETLAPVFKDCGSDDGCKSVADCKSMTVVLASMLEGMGAETMLIDVPNHIYLGVLVARGVTKDGKDSAMRTVTGKIAERYDGDEDMRVWYRWYMKGNGYNVYLLLDPTKGRVPGVVGPEKVIGDYESRPESGRTPSLD